MARKTKQSFDNELFGHSWQAIQRAQQGGRLHDTVKVVAGKDSGADPLPDGMFRMVPSGDIVDSAERAKRLAN